MHTLENNKAGMCSSPEELVAFLYGETDEGVRALTEQHLAACDTCAGEFADLSFARLDVYEWHRDEFVEMATPRIVIPYDEPVSRTSWFESLVGSFAGPGRWATAGAAFAAVAIAAFGFWAIRSNPEERAAVNGDAKVVQSNERPSVAPTPVSVESVPAGERNVTPRKPASAPVKQQQAVPVKATQGALKPAKGRSDAARPVQAKQPPSPRLNDFEDDDDTTLRLGDLLAEIDTRK